MTLNRTVLAFLLFAMIVAAAMPSYAAPASPVEVASIEIAPESPSPGQYPAITARIGRITATAPPKPELFTIIAAVTMPDNMTKSWMWKNVTLAGKETTDFPLPRIFDTRLTGRYKIEYNVYSADMRRRFASMSKSFSVGPAVKTDEQKPAAAKKEETQRLSEENYAFGLGISANALNPAGGGTIMLWPFRNIGLQGSYTVGTFTSYEARLLVRYGRPSGFNPYFAVGFLSVSVEKDVIGVTTTFKDSSVTGAVGVDVPLGRRVRGYVEAGISSIDLQETVTNGPQTVNATVDYTPVTISIGIVYYLF
jgi:hypothetical protein